MYFCVFSSSRKDDQPRHVFCNLHGRRMNRKNTKTNKTHDLNKKDRNNNKKDIKWQKKNTLNTYIE